MKVYIIRTEQRWFDHQAGIYRNWVPGRLYVVRANTTEEARVHAEAYLRELDNGKSRIRCIEETAGEIG